MVLWKAGGERTHRRLVQEVQLRVEALELWVFLLDDADDEVKQRLCAICRFGFQQLGRINTDKMKKSGLTCQVVEKILGLTVQVEMCVVLFPHQI